MTLSVSSEHDTDRAVLLRRAAVRAVRAPSVHNTQPWRLSLEADSLTVRPDRSRQVPVFDPLGRQLLLGCGCAAANAQISLAAKGSAADLRIERDTGAWPAARVSLRPGRPSPELAALDAAIDRRGTPRTPMSAVPLPALLLDRLRLAAAAAGAEVGAVQTADGRDAVERMARLGGSVLASYPEYLTELRAWTRPDGLGPVAAGILGQPERAPWDEDPGQGECAVVWLATPLDDPRAWIEAGVVLERVLLELTLLGLAAVPLAQLVEVPSQRSAFSELAGVEGCLQAVLRVGAAPAAAPSRRRRLVDVIE